MEYTLRAETTTDAPPDQVFDLITDIERLPDWNPEIPKVIEVPSVLDVGAQWVVNMHAMASRWDSRSTVLEIDRDHGRFAYRSQSDDGNPSHSDWRWHLVPGPDGQGTHVTVEVDVRPRTFLRRWFVSRLRRSGLERAMNESLSGLRAEATV